jgi:hypothetical protein
MARFAKGDTIRIGAEVTDYDNTYVTPTSIVITIFQGATVKVNGLAMTTTGSTGKYYYLWSSSVNDASGKYECKVTVVRNSRTSIEHDERAFYLY